MLPTSGGLVLPCLIEKWYHSLPVAMLVEVCGIISVRWLEIHRNHEWLEMELRFGGLTMLNERNSEFPKAYRSGFHVLWPFQ